MQGDLLSLPILFRYFVGLIRIQGMTKRWETSLKGVIERFRRKWGLSSYLQVAIILLVFSLTGITVLLLRNTLFSWLGFDDQTGFWIKSITYLIFIFPAYQVLILVYGSIFGQFRFFWEKERQLIKALCKPFRRADRD